MSDSPGVLLVNLGTPDAPDAWSVRRYLAQFLADPRVVELPRAVWLPILYLFVLTFRPFRSARAYRKVWRDDGSPLLVFSEGLRVKVADVLATRRGAPVPVALGMTYGKPSLKDALAELRAAGCTDITCLPLYPQYSGSTTGASLDALYAAVAGERVVPALRTVNTYATEPAYIDALAASVREAWTDGEPEVLLLSFHGIPKRYVEAGDPYLAECQQTAAALRAALGLDEHRCRMSFQSRFGPDTWLGPPTDDTLEGLAKEGVKTVDVLCPGFSADCLETLEEIAMEGAEIFREAGGERLRAIPCLNDRVDHAEALVDVLERALPTNAHAR